MYIIPMQNMEYQGRFAPSPTGLLHVGNARTALIAWCAARHCGGIFIVRGEDLDKPRVVPGMMEAQMNDLKWLGLDWDAGPDIGGVHGPYLQSLRHQHYQAALDQLHRQEMLFPCTRSRKDLRGLASEPNRATIVCPQSLRPTHDVSPQWYTEANRGVTIRLKVPDQRIEFLDRVFGPQKELLAVEVGDFALRRKDGIYAYQLAVAVDDLFMNITEVVRGKDLLDSTARQLFLMDLLGGTRPSYAHVPLVLNPNGEKLSKRDASLSLAALRESCVAPERLVGYLAWSLGLLPDKVSLSARELIQHFDWNAVKKHRSDWILPGNFLRSLVSDVTLSHCTAT